MSEYADKLASVRSMLKLRPLLRVVRGVGIPITRKNIDISFFRSPGYFKKLRVTTLRSGYHKPTGKYISSEIIIPKASNPFTRRLIGVMNKKHRPAANIAHEYGHALINKTVSMGVPALSGGAQEIVASMEGSKLLRMLYPQMSWLKPKAINRIYAKSLKTYGIKADPNMFIEKIWRKING